MINFGIWFYEPSQDLYVCAKTKAKITDMGKPLSHIARSDLFNGGNTELQIMRQKIRTK